MISQSLRRTVLLALALALLSGWAARTQSPSMESWQAYNGMTDVPEDMLTPLAEQTAQRVADRYPPGRTTIGLHYNSNDNFGSLFEAALREKGFSIDSSETVEADVLQCSYVMDSIVSPDLQEQPSYLRLNFSDGFSIGHIYTYSEENGFVEKGVATSTEAFFSFVSSQSAVIETGEKENERMWIIKPGSLKKQLTKWARIADYQLIWKAEHDFQMQAEATFKDNFYGAVKRLFTRMNRNGNSLRVTLYQQNSVLEVREN